MNLGAAQVSATSAAAEADASLYEEALQRDSSLIVHGWTKQRGHRPEVIAKAAGNYFWTLDGRRILDFRSQAFFANIGHADPRVVRAMSSQLEACAGIFGYATEAKLSLAERILALLPAGYGRVFFGQNGGDSVELALKTARMITGRQNVVAFLDSYHGGSVGASSVSGEARTRLGAGAPLPGTIFVPPPYHYRCPFGGADQEDTEERTLAFIRGTIEGIGADTVAAVIGEPYLTAGPGVIPTPGFWQGIREICDAHGIILIADEVLTGFGRSGAWFGRDVLDYEPDIICMGKGLSGGYFPISATAFSERVADELLDRHLPYGLTHAGHPVGCAAALAVIDILERDELIPRGAEMGDYLTSRLWELAGVHPCIGDVRSIGLFANLELVRNRESKDRFPENASLPDADETGRGIGPELESLLWDSGVLVRATPGIMKFGPPLTIERDEIDRTVELLDGFLDRVDRIIDA